MLPRAYVYLKDKKKVPIPSESTIYKWLEEPEVVQDKMIGPVMNVLETMLRDAPPHMRQCAIALDEIGIDDRYCYDAKHDRVCGNAKKYNGIYGAWNFIRMEASDLLQFRFQCHGRRSESNNSCTA